MSNLQPLLDRVRQASGGDRELDAIVWCALEHPMEKPQRNFFYTNREEWGFFKTNQPQPGLTFYDAPPLTASIDAALSLVERLLPGWNVEIYHGSDRHCVVLNEFPKPCRRIPPEKPYVIAGKTTPLALLDAALCALIAQQAAPAHPVAQTAGEEGR